MTLGASGAPAPRRRAPPSDAPGPGPTALRLTARSQVVILQPRDVAAVVVAIGHLLRAPPSGADDIDATEVSAVPRGSPAPPIGRSERARLRGLAHTLYRGLALAERRWVRERLAADEDA